MAAAKQLISKADQTDHEESLQSRVELVREAFYAVKRPGWEVQPYREHYYVRDVLDDAVVVETDAGLIRIPYVLDDNGVAFDFENQTKVEIVYETKSAEEVQEVKGLVQVLGLAADASEADVLEAVRRLKDAPQSVSLAEHEQVSTQVKNLEQKLAERDRDDAVSGAIRSGKITPAQKEWADQYALADPEGFHKYIESAPVAVRLSHESGGDGAETMEITGLELSVAKECGLTEEDLMNYKKEQAELVA